jgi:hypothetical protein
MGEKLTLGERAPFEEWIQTTAGWKACKARNKPMYLRQNEDGSYNDFRVNDRWFAWMARAHLATPAQTVDIEAVREVIAEMDGYTIGDQMDLTRWADKLSLAIRDKP